MTKGSVAGGLSGRSRIAGQHVRCFDLADGWYNVPAAADPDGQPASAARHAPGPVAAPNLGERLVNRLGNGWKSSSAALRHGVPHRIDNHLATWLGQWPASNELTVTTAPGRVEPGWDGVVHPVVGVSTPDGAVLSVPPDVLDEVRRVAREGGRDALSARLGPMLGRPEDRLQGGVFRWSESPVPATVLPDAGMWVPADDARLPPWLRPFGGEVVVAFIDGRYAAGVGLKRHDHFGWELAVGTGERFAGHGLGRRLVAQAARRVVAEGKVATYLHDPANIASAKVADAAGFPDRGWEVLGLWP